MPLHVEYVGTNENGTPHLHYVQTAEDGTRIDDPKFDTIREDRDELLKHFPHAVVRTGPATGKVHASDGTPYDVSAEYIEVRAEHHDDVVAAINELNTPKEG